MILEVDGLQIHYRTAGGTVRAVDDARHAVPGVVVDLKVLDLEDHRPRSLGMKTSS